MWGSVTGCELVAEVKNVSLQENAWRQDLPISAPGQAGWEIFAGNLKEHNCCCFGMQHSFTLMMEVICFSKE